MKLASCALCVFLGACDGHLATLNIREPSSADHGALRHTLYVCAGRNVLESVRFVAASLELVEETPAGEAIPAGAHEWHSQDSSFRLWLESQSGGSWKVSFVDWPDSSRSALSSRAEMEIRKSLTDTCPSTG